MKKFLKMILDLFNSFCDGKNEKPAPKPVDPVKPPQNPDDTINLSDVI